jgi:riboflavin transporter FmnP
MLATKFMCVVLSWSLVNYFVRLPQYRKLTKSNATLYLSQCREVTTAITMMEVITMIWQHDQLSVVEHLKKEFH